MKIKIIAEIGINHNGSLEIAKKLIDTAIIAGCDYVKFQKRDINIVYDKKTLDTYRESPWGKTNRDQKKGLEFNLSDYREIDLYCKEIGIDWFFSSWDLESQEFTRKYNLKYNDLTQILNSNTCQKLDITLLLPYIQKNILNDQEYISFLLKINNVFKNIYTQHYINHKKNFKLMNVNESFALSWLMYLYH